MRNLIILSAALFIAFQIRSCSGACSSMPSCNLCTTPGICDPGQCANFFGLDSAGQCQNCSLQGGGCRTCTNMSLCNSCSSASSVPYKNQPGCGPCATNCLLCPTAGAGSCDTCKLGFRLDNTTTPAQCLACTQANCSVCNATGCQACVSGYSLINNQCFKCATNCFSCLASGSGNCDPNRCNQGYGLIADQTCQACTATNCAKCDNNTTPSSGTCDVCLSAYTLQPDGTCKHVCKTVPDCAVCLINSNKCTTCNPQYGVTPAGLCSLCTNQANCSNCVNTTYCTRCTDPNTQGPRLDGSGTCGACAPDCLDCTINGAGKCDTCGSGYELTSSNTCLDCSVTNCAKCTGSTCTTCMSGYTLLSNNTCAACAPHCTFCYTNGAGKCDSRYCEASYIYSPSTMTCEAQTTTAVPVTTSTTTTLPTTTPPPQCQTIQFCVDCHLDNTSCIQCEILYGVASDGTCIGCSSPTCSRCQNASLCTSCTDYQNTGPLMDGSGACAPCDPNCRGCQTNGAGKCDIDQCASAYFLNATQQCQVCAVEHCAVCTNGVCTSCITDYGLSNGNCSKCAPYCTFCTALGPGKCDASRYCYPGYIYANQICNDPNATTVSIATTKAAAAASTAVVLSVTPGVSVQPSVPAGTGTMVPSGTGTAPGQTSNLNTTGTTTPIGTGTIAGQTSNPNSTTPNPVSSGNGTMTTPVQGTGTMIVSGNSTSSVQIHESGTSPQIISDNGTTTRINVVHSASNGNNVDISSTTTRGIIQQVTTRAILVQDTSTESLSTSTTSSTTASTTSSTTTQPSNPGSTSQSTETTTESGISTGSLVGGIVGGVTGGLVLLGGAAFILSKICGTAASTAGGQLLSSGAPMVAQGIGQLPTFAQGLQFSSPQFYQPPLSPQPSVPQIGPGTYPQWGNYTPQMRPAYRYVPNYPRRQVQRVAPRYPYLRF